MATSNRERERRYLVTLRREEVERDFLEHVLSRQLGDLAWREPLLLPRIGIAVLSLDGDEVERLARDEHVLRVLPDRRFRDVLPLDAIGRRSPRLPIVPGPHLIWTPTLVPAVPDHLALIGVDKAWACTRGQGVKVAVLDTGVYRDHPQLDVVEGTSFVPDQPDWWKDPAGHGTAVAGILAARESADSVVVGVAPECDLYAVKVVTDANTETQPSWILQGLLWAVEKGVDVVCMSIRPSELDANDTANAPYELEIDRAAGPIYNSGGFLANAAGNTGLSSSVPHLRWPATCVRVVTVGSLDKMGGRDPITCYGSDNPADTNNPDKAVEVMAPGWAVDTTAPPGSNGLYATLGNTSAACPHAAGVAALVKAANPALGPGEIRERLRSTCEDMPPSGWDMLTGFGRLDAAGAVCPSLLNRWLRIVMRPWKQRLRRPRTAGLRKTAPIA